MGVDRRDMVVGLVSGSLAAAGTASAEPNVGAGASGADLAAAVAVLQAREEIKELIARYCWHATRGEAAAMAQLYAPDATFETPVDGARKLFVGRTAILGFLEHAAPPNYVHPMVGNHIITVNGAKAAGTCDMRNLTRQPGGGFAHGAGYYDDRFAHDGRAWLFAARRWFPLVNTAT
jgi:hypothetical protein